MPCVDQVETPRTVAIRIFGATGVLLIAMLLTLHPDAMMSAMHTIAGMAR